LEFHVLPDIEENIERNIDIKWDLESIAQTGSCAGLSEYIFELIIYTKENANLFYECICVKFFKFLIFVYKIS